MRADRVLPPAEEAVAQSSCLGRLIRTHVFYAERVLLSYGQYCVGRGGPELLARMRQAVEGMYRYLGAGEQVEGRKCDPGGGI